MLSRKSMFAAMGTAGMAMGSHEAASANDWELQGRWTAVRADREGQEAADIVGHVLVVEGDEFHIEENGVTIFGGTLGLDTSASPHAIDFKHTGYSCSGKSWWGIYRIDGDTLTICDNGANVRKGRPTSFDTQPESGLVLVVFQRAEQ